MRTLLETRGHLRSLALGSSALSLLLALGSGVAFAQGTPARGSLPGGFTALNGATATYQLNSGSTTSATIAITALGPGAVLQWAPGTPGTPAPTATANPGFSIGGGAELDVTGSGAALFNDLTGNASQIFGTLNASALGGPLYIANPSGIIVGASGAITTPAGGVGLLGYSVDTGSFSGALAINAGNAAASGAITVQSGATISGGSLLVAGNGTINVGVARGSDLPTQTSIIAGGGFTTGPGGVTPTPGAVFANSTASVSFTGGTSGNAIAPTLLIAAGSVSNSGVLDLSGTKGAGGTAGAPTIGGTFSNSGTTTTDNLTAGAIVNATGGVIDDAGGVLTSVGVPGASSGADIINAGTINESQEELQVHAGNPASGTAPQNVPGNFENTGTVDLTSSSGGSIGVHAGNVYLGGSIEVGGNALGAGNALNYLGLEAGYNATHNPGAPSSTSVGVVDVATNAFTHFAIVRGQAARIISGGVTAVGSGGNAHFFLTDGTATDPFTTAVSGPGTNLNYNLSLFPGTSVAGTQGAAVTIDGLLSSSSTPGTTINLNGVLSTADGGGNITVTADTINGNVDANGPAGFALPNMGTLQLTFSGNINNPMGAAAAGSSAFQYNFIPVSVANAGSGAMGMGSGTAGTAMIMLSGPSASGSATPSGTVAQMVNLLVEGNAMPHGDMLPAPPVTPATPVTPYANNHLVVQATGDIMLANTNPDPNPNPVFYWPGLLYLANVTSAADPTALGTGSIMFSNTMHEQPKVDLSNLLPADLTKPDVAGSVGQGGVFLITSHLMMPSGASVTISNDSWANFANAAIASAFQTAQGANFMGGVITSSGAVTTQTLPGADFQPK